MSDDTTPLADPVEARLRATLTAEADRHPVTPDLEGLRARGDRAIVDLDLSPRRNRARLLAVAAVVALLAGVLGVLAVRGAEDDDEPVITDEPPATGYYLPGPGWEVTEIIGAPRPRLPGVERMVELGMARSPEGAPRLDAGSASIAVARITDEDPDLVAVAEGAELEGVRTVTRGEGGEAREYVVADASVATDGGSLVAAVDGRLLVIDWDAPTGEDEVVELADRWWESGGEAIALDPAAGLARDSDVTFSDVEPVPATEMTTFSDLDDPADLYDDAILQVVVQVESPDGVPGTYDLFAPGEMWPTGFQDPEAAAAAGLAPEEVGAPLPAEVGGPMPAWDSSAGIVAEVPGAVVTIDHVGLLGDEVPAEDRSRDLWAALAPVGRAAWVAAGPDETAANGIPDRVWGETLAATSADDLFGAIVGPSGEDPAPVDLEARDGANPAAGLAPTEVDRLVADALLALVGEPGPVDADLFAPLVAFGEADDPTTRVSIAVEDVAAGADEAIEGADPPTPVTQAWNVLWAVSPAEVARLVGEGDEACPPLAEVAADPALVVVVQDAILTDQEPCESWAALVVRLDDQQRITSVEARVAS